MKKLTTSTGMLYEVRTHLDRTIARVIFAIIGDRMILLHGFIKYGRKTPPQDIATAEDRLKKVPGRK